MFPRTIPFGLPFMGDSLALAALRTRNIALDRLFYDVEALTDAESAGVSIVADREGTILVVPPAGQGPIERYADIRAMADAGNGTVAALVIAGIGASALGTAALSRNVADAIGKPVAGVVSGYGTADLMTEALGGWCWFGLGTRVRHLVGEMAPHAPNGADGSGDDTDRQMVASPDVVAAARLLADPRFPIRMAVGHSKGNMVLAAALSAALDRQNQSGGSLDTDIDVVMFSAVIPVPTAFKKVTRVMGEVDWFGRMNSWTDIPIDREIPGAWHYTNTRMFSCLSVRPVIADLWHRRDAGGPVTDIRPKAA